MSNLSKFEETIQIKEALNKISPTFCSAKWLQSTILLYNGETHSCHHPSRHKIPVEGLSNNPKLIHNTPIKLFARKELLEGVQTKECDYCWRIENSNQQNYSDRIYKSGSEWAKPHLENVKSSGLGENFAPSYLEVAFESTCNFACMYCTPDVSTQWAADAEKNGPYHLHTTSMHNVAWLKSSGKYPIHRDAFNPYIEAFWEWWPELYETLEVFRITGGEPLLSKHTWKIFEHIRNNPNTNLEFAVNTNLGVPDKLIDRLINEAKSIQGKVKEFKIFTSAEATGEQANYIRHGMDYEKFISNIDRIMTELPDVRIVIMTTINALSAFSLDSFLEDLLVLRAKHYHSAAHSTLGLSVNYLRWPQFQDIRILPSQIKKEFRSKIEFIIDSHSQKVPGFGEAMLYLEEIDQLQRLLAYADQDLPDYTEMIKDFKIFFNEYDIRRGLNFTQVFPEIAWMVV